MHALIALNSLQNKYKGRIEERWMKEETREIEQFRWLIRENLKPNYLLFKPIYLY